MEETQVTPVDVADIQGPKEKNTLRTIGIVAACVVLVALIGGAIYGLASHPATTEVIRDIFIIVLALVTIVIGLFLAILIFQLQSLIALLRDEIKPILQSANETASTVRGTTTFVSDAVVTPVITAASYVSAIRHTLRTLRTNPAPRRSRQDTDQADA